VDFAPVFRCKAGKVEEIDGKLVFFLDGIARDIRQAIALRHLPGTGVLAARRSVDDENARLPALIFMLPLRLENRVSCREPID
jgi:hypothetical protein